MSPINHSGSDESLVPAAQRKDCPSPDDPAASGAPAGPEPSPVGDLRLAARSGVRASGAEALGLTSIQLVGTVIVARLLSPSDFGLVAQVTVIHGFLTTLADAGLGNAIIHFQASTEGELSSLYWAQVLLALMLGIALAAMAPLLAAFYDEPRLVSVALLLSATPLLASAGAQHAVLLKRDLRFRPLAAVQIGSALVGLATTVIGALMGLAFYSLVAGTLSRVAFTSVVLGVIHWRSWHPRLHFRFRELRRYLRFGAFQVGERALNYWTANLDYLLIGRFIGPDALGLYRLSYELAVKPMHVVNPVITKVMFPVFARIQKDDATTGRWYAQVQRTLAALNAPVLAALGVSAPWLVPAVFGEQWREAAPLLSVLVVMGMAKTLANPAGSVLLARGRADVGLYWNLVTVALIVPVFVLAAPYGVSGIAVAWGGVTIVLFPISVLVLQRVAAVDARQVFGAILAPIGLALAAGMVGLGLTRLVGRLTSLPDWGSLSLAAISTLVLYLICGLWLMPDVTARIRGILLRRQKGPMSCPGS